ncbi:ABC transporter permease [Streptomyces sp. TP-A0356]|uniref:ABC transporter permease n=1 Tax=Streptomyces sp. TP-A0356 TaxID=1359208 RepID=UPI0006E216F6|nr:ABC transporter permease [Streptomyces sp. TP-A0356]
MSPIRLGLARGALELRQVLRNRKDLYSYLATPVIFLGVASWRSDGRTPETTDLMLAGGVGATNVMFGLMTVPQFLFGDREDGTLLRLRGIPGAMAAYLTAKTVFVLANIAMAVALLLAGGNLILGASLPSAPAQWLTLIWVVTLGIAAVVPVGAAIGALLPPAREALGLYMMPIMMLMFVSGAFSPLKNQPTWVQHLASVFPLRWIAQGVRSALLPDHAKAQELAGDWQHLTIIGVLVTWTIVGFIAAPALLQRMTRRESGSRMSDRETKRLAKAAY